MLRQIAVILPVLLAGIILGAWAREPRQDTQPASVRDFDHAADYERLEQMISSLTEIVDLEVAERRRLEEQIANLASQVANLNGKRAGPETQPTVEELKARVASASRSLRSVPIGEVSADRFVRAGFPADVAERLKRDMDQIALDRLYLRDQAVREGWLGSSRYREELQELNRRQELLRQELSPEDTDRYLFALGRPNRINVTSVLSGSPADKSGLLAGDAILSYNGTRVFSPSEIRSQTTRGDSGAMVPVEILRDGQRQVLYLPRGPLGVNMSATSTKP